jgi:hypothetical protein
VRGATAIERRPSPAGSGHIPPQTGPFRTVHRSSLRGAITLEARALPGFFIAAFVALLIIQLALAG